MEEEKHNTIYSVQLLSLVREVPCLSQAESSLCSPGYIAICSWASSLVPLSHPTTWQGCPWLPWCLSVGGQNSNILDVFNPDVSSHTYSWRLSPTQVRWHLIPFMAELDDHSPLHLTAFVAAWYLHMLPSHSSVFQFPCQNPPPFQGQNFPNTMAGFESSRD